MGYNSEKRIQIILKNGSLFGWVYADDGVIEINHCPHTEASSKAFEKQIKNKSGVYILYSDTEIYVGRATDLSSRIATHLREKNFWNHVITLSKKNQLDPTMLARCESILIDKSQSLNNLKCNNKKNGDLAYVNSFQESEANEFIEEAIILMNVVGIHIFEDDNSILRRKLSEGTRRVNEAIELLRTQGVIISQEYHYCSNASDHTMFAVDVDTRKNEFSWQLIVNNVVERNIYVFNIPKGILSGIRIRKDTNKYVVRFCSNDYKIKGTQIILSHYLTNKIKY